MAENCHHRERHTREVTEGVAGKDLKADIGNSDYSSTNPSVMGTIKEDYSDQEMFTFFEYYYLDLNQFTDKLCFCLFKRNKFTK